MTMYAKTILKLPQICFLAVGAIIIDPLQFVVYFKSVGVFIH